MSLSQSLLPARDLEGVRVPLSSERSVEQALLWLRCDLRPFALVGDWLDGEGVAVLGSHPVAVAGPDRDPFSVLDEQPVLAGGDAAIGGGWVGWLGYGLGARIERLPPAPPAPAARPPFSLAFYDHLVLFDGERWWFEALWSTEREADLRRRLAVWQARLQTEPPPAGEAVPAPFALTGNGGAGHLSAVAECRRRIAAGELLQANLCVRLESGFDGDPLDLLARALPRAQPRFGACVDGAISLSPERFLRRRGRVVRTEPIKGTRPRTGADRERGAARDELLASGKDAAEHVMIVDLMRNDLGRVCEYGTIAVDPARVEAHAGVWHLVSSVSGRLREDVGDADLLRATFPPGSVTGAPKVQAMKVIAELEATRRELYTGAIGIVSPLAGLDLSVAIRTFEIKGRRIWFGAGGGIVAESDPELELAEALDKAAGPVAALGSRTSAPAPSRPRVPIEVPRALRHGSRPDPAHGVFETLLVQDGRPGRLEQHLARLSASLAELYGAELDPGVAARALDAAAGAGAGRARMRILAEHDGSVAITLSHSPIPDAPAEAALLTPFLLPGGLGAHKWSDRRLLEELAACAPGTVPLLLDTDGQVLEAAHANVWIVEDATLLTPPADGRILPGITRAGLLSGEPSAREEPLELARLEKAEAVFLTSSITLRRPARLAGAGAVAGAGARAPGAGAR